METATSRTAANSGLVLTWESNVKHTTGKKKVGIKTCFGLLCTWQEHDEMEILYHGHMSPMQVSH